MNRTTIDLNADLGEIPERIRSGVDDLLMECVSSANIACGGHAGDVLTMEAMVASAMRHGSAIGAHVAYPDREGFGRRSVEIDPEALLDALRRQIEALAEVCARYGASLRHVKPHGALYHAASSDPATAAVVARAAAVHGRSLLLVGYAGSPALDVWREMGFRVAAEGFADRRYEPDGTLTPRSEPGAVLSLVGEAAAQALRIARGEGVIATDGSLVPVEADTIGLHGDGPNPLGVARVVRRGLEEAGFRLRALSDLEA